MPPTIQGADVFKRLARLGDKIKAGNKNVLKQGGDMTFKLLVGNMTRIETGSLLSSAKLVPLQDGFEIQVGQGRNSRTGKPISAYSIPQDLGFQHYRNSFIRGTNAAKIAVDSTMEKIVDNLNHVVYTEIMKALSGK